MKSQHAINLSKRKFTDVHVWHMANLKTGKVCDFFGKKDSIKLFDLSTNSTKVIAQFSFNLN